MTTYNTLKLCRLIVYSKFHKICKFEHHVTRNDVIMMSLPKQWKQWENVDLRGTKKYISFKKFWWELSKNVTFIEFEPLCQKLWAFMSSFTITAHQIWSCHMTLATNFDNFYFCLTLYEILGKLPNSGEIGSRTKKLQGKKQNSVWKTPSPPSAYKVNLNDSGNCIIRKTIAALYLIWKVMSAKWSYSAWHKKC